MSVGGRMVVGCTGADQTAAGEMAFAVTLYMSLCSSGFALGWETKDDSI